MQAAIDQSPRVSAQRKQIDAMFGTVAQRTLSDDEIESLVAAVRPLYAATDTNALQRAQDLYAAADPTDAENTILKKLFDPIRATFAQSNNRRQQQLHWAVAQTLLFPQLAVLDRKLCGDEAAHALAIHRVLRTLGSDFSDDERRESEQILAQLPSVAWTASALLDRAQIDTAAHKPSLGEALTGIVHPIDQVRVRRAFHHHHPPADLVDTPLPARASLPARVLRNVTAESRPPTPYPADMDPEIVKSMREKEEVERAQTRRDFHAGDQVWVLRDQTNPAWLLVTYQTQPYCFRPADLALSSEPATGRLGSGHDVPLFGASGPMPDDIGQQALGDCFLLAALGSLAHQHPAYIREMVRPTGVNRYAVRLFKKTVKADYGTAFMAHWIQVDDVVHVDAQGQPLYAKGNRALWPGLVEKAYAAFRGDYSTIGSGDDPARAMEIIMGRSSDASTLAKADRDDVGSLGSKRYGEPAIALFKRIDKTTKRGGLVVLGTSIWGQGGTGISGGENTTDVPGLASTHAYSVFGTKGDPAKKSEALYVTVRNPWGRFGRRYKTSLGWGGFQTAAEEQEAGTFDLELSDLMRHADRISFNPG